MPFISILIPTRNRKDLLINAVKSVQDQGFDDYEIIVSDNYSNDGTEKAVSGINSSKIRYFRTEKLIPANENSENALRHSIGKYFLLIGDDDYLVQNTLMHIYETTIKTNANIITIGPIAYYDNTFVNPALRNHIMVRPFTGKCLKIDPGSVVDNYFGLKQNNGYPPHASTIVVKRETADRVIKKCGAFFMPPFAEVVTTPIITAMSDYYYVIDKPMIIIGRGSNSQVELERSDPKTMWSHISAELKYTLLRGKYSVNAHCESVLNALHLFPEYFSGYSLDTFKYFKYYYQKMVEVGKNCAEFRVNRKEFWSKLNQIPVNIRIKFAVFLIGYRIKRIISGNFITKLRRLLLRMPADMAFVNGASLGINSIEECLHKIFLLGKKSGYAPNA